jgi:hypothetical protein
MKFNSNTTPPLDQPNITSSDWHFMCDGTTLDTSRGTIIPSHVNDPISTQTSCEALSFEISLYILQHAVYSVALRAFWHSGA